jgi:hypothetical protein
MSTWLAEGHTQWHQMYGKYGTCPLDCGAGEIVSDTFAHDDLILDAMFVESGARGIRCGSCKGRHALVSTVKFCYEVKRDAETFARNEAAMEKALDEAGECEHGLSALLCSGPGHYPPDRYDD